jgi:hypothetical protein
MAAMGRFVFLRQAALLIDARLVTKEGSGNFMA